MTHDRLTAPATALTARAEYHSDWHIYVDDPVDGSLGYCTGTGPDEPFDPDAATRALERGGWRVTHPWTEMPLDGRGALHRDRRAGRGVVRGHPQMLCRRRKPGQREQHAGCSASLGWTWNPSRHLKPVHFQLRKRAV
ncbi:hypothetical protein ACWC9Q_37855 [Streptomyces sp. NPDC001142]